jgi:hypothetical protein
VGSAYVGMAWACPAPVSGEVPGVPP